MDGTVIFGCIFGVQGGRRIDAGHVKPPFAAKNNKSLYERPGQRSLERTPLNVVAINGKRLLRPQRVNGNRNDLPGSLMARGNGQGQRFFRSAPRLYEDFSH